MQQIQVCVRVSTKLSRISPQHMHMQARIDGEGGLLAVKTLLCQTRWGTSSEALLTCPTWCVSRGVVLPASTVMITSSLSPSVSDTEGGDTSVKKSLPGAASATALKCTGRPPFPEHTAVSVRLTVRVSPTLPEIHGPFISKDTLSQGQVEASRLRLSSQLSNLSSSRLG